jgi:hypothetical protein
LDQRKKIIRVFSSADFYGKIPQIKRIKSADFFFLDQRKKKAHAD